MVAVGRVAVVLAVGFSGLVMAATVAVVLVVAVLLMRLLLALLPGEQIAMVLIAQRDRRIHRRRIRTRRHPLSASRRRGLDGTIN